MGRPEANDFVKRACAVAIRDCRPLRDVLIENPDVASRMTPEELNCLFDPTRYLGVTQASIDRVLVRAVTAGAGPAQTWIDLDDVRIHYTDSGEKDRPVLVFSHPVGADLTIWNAQLAEFARHFRILRCDTRGHGLSSSPPGPYSIEQLSRDVLALLDRLAIDSCCFCGLSLGGMIGQWLGIHAPNRIKRLVLCNTAAKIGTIESWNARINAVIGLGLDSVIPAILDRWYTQPFHQANPGEIERTRAMLAAVDPAGYAACCAAIRDMDQREAIGAIRVATLVIAGTHDQSTPAADGRFLAESIPGAEYLELNAAHISNVEAAGDFNAAVLHFLIR
jgi:3-oxoadipate enol-lactonase